MSKKAEKVTKSVVRSIRFPLDLAKRLNESTASSRRTFIAEVIYRLEKSFILPHPPAHGE